MHEPPASQANADTDSEADVKLVPTAPPMHISLSTVLDGGGDLLSLEPPKWLPDSHAAACGICNQDFRSHTLMQMLENTFSHTTLSSHMRLWA